VCNVVKFRFRNTVHRALFQFCSKWTNAGQKMSHGCPTSLVCGAPVRPNPPLLSCVGRLWEDTLCDVMCILNSVSSYNAGECMHAVLRLWSKHWSDPYTSLGQATKGPQCHGGCNCYVMFDIWLKLLFIVVVRSCTSCCCWYSALTGLRRNQLWVHRPDHTDGQLHWGWQIHWSRKRLVTIKIEYMVLYKWLSDWSKI